MGDDTVELRQCLDLVDDDLAHLRGGLGGLLRHFQHAAAQLVAGRFQLALHLGGHLLHAADHGGELVGGLLEHRIRFFGALLIDLGHRIRSLAAFFLGCGANRFELPADRGRSGACGFRHHPRDIAGTLFRGRKRLVEQAGETRQPLIEVGGAQVDGVDEGLQRRLALGERG